MREIHPCVRLVVGVLKIVYPACSVWIDVHDIGVEKVVVPVSGLVTVSLTISPSSVRYAVSFEMIGRSVGGRRSVLYSRVAGSSLFSRLPRPCGCRFRNDSLSWVGSISRRPVIRVGAIYALRCSLLGGIVFIWGCARVLPYPGEIGGNRVALLVFLNLEGFVCRL